MIKNILSLVKKSLCSASLFLVICCNFLNAQTVAVDYVFSYVAGTAYNSFTDGTIANNSTSWDDFTTNNVSIGFPFYFNGATYATCNINSNGYITFGSAPANDQYNPISSSDSYDGAISAFARDLFSGSNANNARVQYKVLGSSPNRVFVVQWTDAKRYNFDGKFSFQIKLYEGSNTIEVHYGGNSEGTSNNTTDRTDRLVQVGLRGASNADYNNRTTTSNWANTNAGTSNGATNSTTNTIRPISSSIYRWTLKTIRGSVPLTVNGTWTVPCGVTQIEVEAWGAGGAGGSTTANFDPTRAGGGGGGAYAKKTFSVNTGDSFAYSIGAGGVSGSNSLNGGDSWFGSSTNILAKGGNGVGNNSSTGGNGGLASSSIGDVRYSGGKGANGGSSSQPSGGGGGAATASSDGGNGNGVNGGTSTNPGGSGGDGVTAGFLGGNFGGGEKGADYGGGGGGARSILGWFAQNGGAGASGFIRITYAFPNTGTPPPVTIASTISTNPTTDIGCVNNQVTLQASGGNVGAGVSTLWYEGTACPTFAYIQEFMGDVSPAQNTTIGTVTNGNRTFTSTTSDPRIDMGNVLSTAITPTVHRYMTMRYRVVSGTAGIMKIYIKRANVSSYSETNSQAGNYNNDGQWHIMTIDMGTNAGWTNTGQGGNITGWRFDFADANNVVMEIDYLALSSVRILENTNVDDSIITVQPNLASTTYGSLRISDQASVCGNTIPYTTCIQTIIERKDKTFIGAIDNNWDKGGNWSFTGVPDNSHCVFINNGKTVVVNIPTAEAKSIQVAANGKLTISSANALTVTNTLVNLGTSENFILESGGNLLQLNETTVNSTPISVRSQHNLTSARNQYNYVSSPVVGQNLKAIYGGNAANMPFSTVLNEPTNMFVNATTADYAIKGKGFSVKEPVSSGFVNTNGLNNDGLAEYQGVPNNGIITTPITRTGTRGWNLIGNPYPSNIDLKAFYDDNMGYLSTAEFRYWDNRANKTYTQFGGKYKGYSYAIYNAESNVGNPAPGGDTGNNGNGTETPSVSSVIAGRYAEVGQGFLVRAKANGNLTFKNSYRVNNATTSFFGKKVADAKRDLYQLQMVTPDKLVLTQTIVYYDGGNNGFGLEDSKHPSVSSSDAFYGFAGDEKVVINGRDKFVDSDVILLGDNHFVTGEYVIRSIERSGVFANGQSIYLKDKLLNIVTDITKSDYVFSSETGEFTNRFEIVYTPQSTLLTSESVKNTILVYKDGTDFVISSIDIINKLEVYNMSGNLVYRSTPKTKIVRINNRIFETGIYILRMELNNGVVFSKKIRN